MAETASTISGYIEGYYGRLLDWEQRERIIQHLGKHGFSHYFYAPKEDVNHRLRWRQAYSPSWREDYTRFCEQAARQDVHIVAGVAPGLDFDFAELPADSLAEGVGNVGNGGGKKGDWAQLLDKSQQLLADGAGTLSLLMDDIDEDFHTRAGAFTSEGEAHAHLANRLGDELQCDLWVVPRAYADDIAAQSPDYLPAFLQTLDQRHTVVYCGMGIIARTLSRQSLRESLGEKHKVVIWDNLYANDYCPRRLFLGPYAGREPGLSLLLNPTGMLETDCFLLDLMHATLVSGDPHASWSEVLERHQVPGEFSLLSPYFGLPAFGGRAGVSDPEVTDAHYAALEVLLWKWKTPLSREWYPWLLSLKQDFLLSEGRLPDDRIFKILPSPLASAVCKES